MPTPTRIGRWLAVGFAGVILAATAASGTASARPVVQPTPLPCDKLSPLPQCFPPVPTSTARCHDWTVEKVRAVGGGPHLLVSAVCAVRGNERLQLRRHDPQGINPANLLLELVVSRGPFPPGPTSHEERVIDVEPDAGFTSVTILPDGPTLAIEDPA